MAELDKEVYRNFEYLNDPTHLRMASFAIFNGRIEDVLNELGWYSMTRLLLDFTAAS